MYGVTNVLFVASCVWYLELRLESHKKGTLLQAINGRKLYPALELFSHLQP